MCVFVCLEQSTRAHTKTKQAQYLRPGLRNAMTMPSNVESARKLNLGIGKLQTKFNKSLTVLPIVKQIVVDRQCFVESRKTETPFTTIDKNLHLCVKL